MSRPETLLLLSGEICAGKSSVAKVLIQEFNFRPIETGKFLKSKATKLGLSTDRKSLQKLGNQLDVDTGGEWLIDLMEFFKEPSEATKTYLLDSVRKDFQIQIFRNLTALNVAHIHVTAPEKAKKSRYELRRETLEHDSQISYEDAINEETELGVKRLQNLADLVLDTNNISPAQSAEQVVQFLTSRNE